MTDHGFIDPDAPTKRRLDRLEALITEVLPLVDWRSALSPEAQATVDDLLSENAVRQERARRRMRAQMDADPLVDVDGRALP